MIVNFGMYYQMYGRQKIEIPDDENIKTVEDAAEYIKDNWNDIPLPTNANFVDGSDELDEESVLIENETVRS